MVLHIAMFSWKNRPTPVGQFSKIFAPDGPSIWRGLSNTGGPSKLGGGLLLKQHSTIYKVIKNEGIHHSSSCWQVFVLEEQELFFIILYYYLRFLFLKIFSYKENCVLFSFASLSICMKVIFNYQESCEITMNKLVK
jgi:hypothetical protein